MKIVETPKKTYLATEVVETSNGMSQLGGAVVVDSYDEEEEDMAFKFIKATLLEKHTEVKVRTSTIESIEEASGVAKLVKKLEAKIPEARKRAEIKAVIDELRDFDNDDDDD